METLGNPTTTKVQKDLEKTAREIGPEISKYVEEEETNRRLSPSVVRTLRNAGFFKMFQPEAVGGLETDPLTAARVIEEVARHNTAAAWSLMVTNTSPIMLVKLPDDGINAIYGNHPDVFVAGSVHPPMSAIPVKGGYSITGRNPLFSNVHEAHWLVVLAFVMENGQMKMQHGHPEIIAAVMKASDCEIIDTWHTISMKGTDSNDVSAKDVFVPDYLSLPLNPELAPNPRFQGPLYRFPASGANIACLFPPVSLALARNAINELKSLAEKKTPLGSMVSIKQKGAMQRKLGIAEAMVQSSRAYLYEAIEECWEKVKAGNEVSREEKARLLLAATHTNQTCTKAVDLMYSAAGSTAIYTRNKIAHYFTDAQVLKQHGFVNDSRYETAAQIYFGLPADLPLVEF
ncbi:MAG TPA: acyl-CoA dehydrogenase family protein [Saprospiraceae bacterium]|nr:acyl-CoA dehydrogenase family protein [Saprospiraceae bacterium]HNT21765.1 acyl-CoA dehydrogenase family protein [Saprospiraceae bacterium]